MPKIIIDNQEIECREGVSVLQAAIDAGWDVPHYCYHPSLSVVASCRLCLMEMKMPHPKTQGMGWAPKLIPSCQTPVREGMEVRFNSEVVKKNQATCMEFFLLNHPLDCPVCDQAGECYLQDYSYKFGYSESRMVDQKLVNPKKDIGPKTLLYSDRCVMCTQCVRFTQEISGTHELCVVNRGSRAEIDVFPGLPLDNPLQGNVVDICPVGSLLDKDFLFQRRVWELESAPSICPGCATGCAIRIDQADNKIYRLKPRYNPLVNDCWMCDEGRYGWKYVEDENRITAPIVRRGREQDTPDWAKLPDILRFRFDEYIRENSGAQVAAVLSPFMATEEAWLLIKFIHGRAPDASLSLGPVPVEGDEQRFPVGAVGDAVKFTILNEKCPNRRGIEMLLDSSGGNVMAFEEFVERCNKGDIGAAWIVGGYPNDWAGKDLIKAAGKLDLLVVQDLLAGALSETATVVLPACSWAERDGSFVNATGLAQPFERALDPPDGARRDGQYLFELAGCSGLYSGGRVREMMAESGPAACEV
jgi:NADH-quinone oxidoreductase subunit G